MSVKGYRFNDKPIDFAYRRYSANYEHPETFHSHLGIELLLIHQGRGTMIINNRSYRIEPGMLCIFQPYQLHHVRLDYSDGQCFERSLTVFEPSMFEAYFEKWPMLRAFFTRLHRDTLPTACLYGIGEDHMLVHLFHDFQENSLHIPEAERPEAIALFLMNLFQTIKPIWKRMEQESNTSLSSTRKPRRVEEILGWIEQNYASPYRLDDLADALHLSPYHVSHLFKEAIGVSISDYISARRIHQAVRLLKTTEKPISFIAEEIGLTNVSYFCKLFKANMNVTPHQYRKRWAKA